MGAAVGEQRLSIAQGKRLSSVPQIQPFTAAACAEDAAQGTIRSAIPNGFAF